MTVDVENGDVLGIEFKVSEYTGNIDKGRRHGRSRGTV